MKEVETNTDEAAAAVSAYLAASQVALESFQRLNEEWRQHLEAGAVPPSRDWIAQVSEHQMASELALARARAAKAVAGSVSALQSAPAEGFEHASVVKIKRKRRRENPFLDKIGKPGQRVLRAVLLIALVFSILLAVGVAISLALEIAGILRLIDDPVRLPFGNQLAIFITAAAAAFGIRALLKPVERALYGSKGVRPKGFPL